MCDPSPHFPARSQDPPPLVESTGETGYSADRLGRLVRDGWDAEHRWSDVDFDGRAVRWRAEHDKTGHEHTTPVTAEALSVLEDALARRSGADLPLKVLCELGGWRDAKTVLSCYQHTNEMQLRKALESRCRVDA